MFKKFTKFNICDAFKFSERIHKVVHYDIMCTSYIRKIRIYNINLLPSQDTEIFEEFNEPELCSSYNNDI